MNNGKFWDSGVPWFQGAWIRGDWVYVRPNIDLTNSGYLDQTFFIIIMPLLLSNINLLAVFSIILDFLKWIWWSLRISNSCCCCHTSINWQKYWITDDSYNEPISWTVTYRAWEFIKWLSQSLYSKLNIKCKGDWHFTTTRVSLWRW